MSGFQHHDLVLLNPAFDSRLVDVVTELEHLRRLKLGGTTHPLVFFQLKHIFHMLESLSSARIEGNHTTLADYVESRLTAQTSPQSDQLREIANIEDAMTYIEKHFAPGQDVTGHFLRELHAMAVNALVREGDPTPGAYRQGPVKISQSDHVPPDAFLVPNYMAELAAFINKADPPKYDLIKVAIAHHRFAWIHPFTNGNGRVVRLLTYILLIKYGFDVSTHHRVLNPSAVFCTDRNLYYAMLAQADTGSVHGREAWCTYVLEGLCLELSKIFRLTDSDYLNKQILIPALAYARKRELLTALEEKVLLRTAQSGTVKAIDLANTMSNMTESQRTYQIRKLVERGMLMPIRDGARQYTLGFGNNFLIRGVIEALHKEGFITDALNAPHQGV